MSRGGARQGAGHPTKPTALKVLEGTARKDRVHADEPKPIVLDINTPPPTWLKTDARAGWRDAVPLLVGMRVASVADQVAIGHLCVAFARWNRAYKATHKPKFEPVYSTTQDNGSVVYKEHPAVMQEERAAKLLMEALREFGMTPAARARIHAIPEPEGGSGPRNVSEPPPLSEWLQAPTQ